MKYICPDCNKEFDTEEKVTQHLFKCWKDNHPHQKSKQAPRSEDIYIREMNSSIFNFFSSFGKGNSKNEGNID